jgi:hypothetical protein
METKEHTSPVLEIDFTLERNWRKDWLLAVTHRVGRALDLKLTAATVDWPTQDSADDHFSVAVLTDSTGRVVANYSFRLDSERTKLTIKKLKTVDTVEAVEEEAALWA